MIRLKVKKQIQPYYQARDDFRIVTAQKNVYCLWGFVAFFVCTTDCFSKLSRIFFPEIVPSTTLLLWTTSGMSWDTTHLMSTIKIAVTQPIYDSFHKDED